MLILLASNNPHKKREFQDILSPHCIRLPEEMGITFQHEETGTTFQANALGKAHELFTMTRKPVIADDSGLSVSALNGAPGIFSARYGEAELGKTLTDREKVDFLLENMKDIADREAFFVCSLVFYVDDFRFFSVQETVHGRIAEKPAGTGGFGYDPVFFLPDRNKTVAELEEKDKNSVSHRGKAGGSLRHFIDYFEKHGQEE